MSPGRGCASAPATIMAAAAFLNGCAPAVSNPAPRPREIPQGAQVRFQPRSGEEQTARLLGVVRDSLWLVDSCQKPECSDRSAADATRVALSALERLEYSPGTDAVNGLLIGFGAGVFLGALLAASSSGGGAVSPAAGIVVLAIPLGVVGLVYGALSRRWVQVELR